VLLSRSGEIKLADFGIAKATQLANVHRSQARKGKLGYMSPEQVRDEPLTPRSDQFALASTLYEALTGVPAFAGTSPVDALARVEQALLPPLDGLAPPLADLLRRAWARTPAERWGSALELAHALAEIRGLREADVGAWVRQVLT
jgi:serine/threonine-protein kinase